MRSVPVWDIATRAFHWALVTAVVVCLLTGEDEGLAFTIHAYAGFLVLSLVAFRFGWGVVGSQHSLFSDFIYSWSTVSRYAVSLLKLRPEHYVGHNPLGGWMVVLMLLGLTATAVSGFLTVAGGVRWLEDFHEVFGNFMQVLILVHIAGVVVDQVLMREKLVQAMFTGRKELPAREAAVERPLVGTWRALVLAGLVAVAGVYLFNTTDYSGKIVAAASREGGGRSHGGDHD